LKNNYRREVIEEKIKEIIQRMSIEEKVWQMGMVPSSSFRDEKGNFLKDKADERFKGYSIGGIQDTRFEPNKSLELIKTIQDYIKKETSPGIPAIVVGETLHGYLAPEATIFPQVIGLGSTWNTELIGLISKAAAREARSVGTNLVNSPDLDIVRDPRWGRVEETFGEDPFLVSKMGLNVVKGLQGDGKRPSDEITVSSIKHYVAHGMPEGGINTSPVSGGERLLRELYLKPFATAIKDGGALAVMPCYSEYDGIPVHASKFLLTNILRGELKFKGLTIADYSAVSNLHNRHRIAENRQHAGELAVKAGIDFEAGGISCYGDNLIELVKNGTVPENIINEAVTRILRVKFHAGIMDNPYGNEEKIKKYYGCKAHKNLALEAARESIVLLKNKNSILPLNKNIKNIAVIGPNADRGEIGDYSYPNDGIVTPIQGIKNIVSSKCKINYAKGCGLWEQDRSGFNEAVNAAKNAEIAIVIVGETSVKQYGMEWGRETDDVILCGEGFDRHDISLPGVQENLVKEIIKTGIPTILVLINGRPIALGNINEKLDAIIEAWYPGQAGGTAIAEILFGDVNPSGKLTMSFPRETGQIPVYYNHKPSARGVYKKPGTLESPGRDYVFLDTEPLYKFGHGLSYTTFEYSELRVHKKEIPNKEDIIISVNVKNTGKREGKEVVQLYINDVVSSVTTPVKELKGFKKINLKPDEETTVTFILPQLDLAIFDENMKEAVEPGEFEIMIANLKSTFRILI
jgi:beta-glucosidase